ncbi:TPM domain-containing protein [Nitrospira sp. Kam-Ns4a]
MRKGARSLPRAPFALVATAVLLAVVALPARADQETTPLPGPMGYVSDFAGVLDPDWKARIRSVCQDLERKTGVELVVVTVRTLAPDRNAQAYAGTLYKQWGIGTAQQGYGALILMSLEEGQAAVTLGRNLSLVVPASVLEEIAGKVLQPAFRTGEHGEGLYRAAVMLASSAQHLRIGSRARPHSRGLGIFLISLVGAAALFFLWYISRPDLRHPFGRIRRGEFWGSGRGGFGGNFGGFGGGTSGDGWR